MYFITHLIQIYGLVIVAAIVGLETLGIPLPGEAAFLAAAVYAGTKHDLNIIAGSSRRQVRRSSAARSVILLAIVLAIICCCATAITCD